MRFRIALGLALVLAYSLVRPAAGADDPVLARVVKELPAGWRMHLADDRLGFYREGDIYVLSVNRINAAVSRETAQEREARVRASGKRAQARLVFRVEPRWTRAQWTKARKTNASLDAAIAALPARYHIADLLDKRLSRKGTEVFIPRNDDDKKRIAACERETERLRGQRVDLPTYATRTYSLFPLEAIGRDDDMHEVVPQSASQDLSRIEQTLQKLCPPEAIPLGAGSVDVYRSLVPS